MTLPDPGIEGATTETTPEARMCPWCGTEATTEATTCSSCGAAIAARESLGGLVIRGVTAVDPALAAYDAQPWHLAKSSPSQGMAGGTVMAAAALGGPAGLVALAGLAAVAATEYAGASRGDGGPGLGLEQVGRPMEPALQMLEQLQREEAEAGKPGTLPRAGRDVLAPSADVPAPGADAEPGGTADGAHDGDAVR